MKHSGLKCECPISLWTGDELSESMCSLSEEQHAKLARWMAAILEAMRIQREQAWIPVSERLPEDKQMVIAWGGPEMENPIVLRYIGGRQFHDFFKNWVAVTHWMPLPQPPEAKP